MTDPIRLSPSKIEMYARCGVQYYNRYLLGKREPPGVAMLVGRSMDVAISESLIRKADGRGLPSVEEVATMAGDAATREFDDAGSDVLLNESEKERGLKLIRDAAKDRSVRMAVAYRKKVAPMVRPEIDWKTGKPRVQHSWELEMPDGIVLSGRSDVEEVDKGVRDSKSSAKPKPEAWVHTSLQLTAYALSRYSIDGHEEVPVRLDVMVDRPESANKLFPGTDPAGVEWQPLVSNRSVPDFYSYIARVKQTAKSIRAGVFMPAQPDSWLCSKKFCGFYGSCPHAARPRHFAVAEAPRGIEKEDVSDHEEA